MRQRDSSASPEELWRAQSNAQSLWQKAQPFPSLPWLHNPSALCFFLSICLHKEHLEVWRQRGVSAWHLAGDGWSLRGSGVNQQFWGAQGCAWWGWDLSQRGEVQLGCVLLSAPGDGCVFLAELGSHAMGCSHSSDPIRSAVLVALATPHHPPLSTHLGAFCCWR